MANSVRATNIRQKSISPWNRVWEVLCPHCGEIRSRKDRPKRGIMVLPCRSCACTIRSESWRRENRSWRWALAETASQTMNVSCILTVCSYCTKPFLQRTHIYKAVVDKAWFCSVSCARHHDKEKHYAKIAATARININVHSWRTFSVSHCALCGKPRIRKGTLAWSLERYLYCLPCAGKHEGAFCNPRRKAVA